MFSLTNSTFDFLVSELLLQTLLFSLATAFLGLSRLHSFPVSTRSEDDVFTYARRVRLWSLRLALLQTKLGPRPPLGNLGVHFFFVNRDSCFASDFDEFVVVVQFVGYRRLGAIFVDSGGRRWNFWCSVCGGFGLIDVFCPVAAERLLVLQCPPRQ